MWRIVSVSSDSSANTHRNNKSSCNNSYEIQHSKIVDMDSCFFFFLKHWETFQNFRMLMYTPSLYLPLTLASKKCILSLFLIFDAPCLNVLYPFCDRLDWTCSLFVYLFIYSNSILEAECFG